ncbi:MAG: HD domain-containing phosphohydrolase [Thermodesulfobacteriota bacterium]
MQETAAQKSVPLKTGDELNSLKILVVDDEPNICETLQLYFQHLGVEYADTAENGRSALEYLETRTYDYVFLDIMLPDMTGLEVLKALQGLQKLVNVIIMTGYPSMEVAIDAMHNGASDFLVKPFGFQDIKLTLSRIQRLHTLMKRNWELHQELEKKKEVEALNQELEKRIKHQALLYGIIDSLSKINRSDDLYQFLVDKALESCDAAKACFLFYDESNPMFLVLAQRGMNGLRPGTPAVAVSGDDGRPGLDAAFLKPYFGTPNGRGVTLDRITRHPGMIGVPFRIRSEPFGLLLVGNKAASVPFDLEDQFILGFLAEKTALSVENIALYDNLKQSFIATLLSLVSAIEAKDAYTQQHSTRVTDYAVRIADRMEYSTEDIEMMKSTAPLHDIGKIGIQDAILNKPGRLTGEEFDLIRAHPIIGVNIVAPLGLDKTELSIIRNHHERWDGRGYPDGLKQEEIPPMARILAVADAFDAMSSDRAYRSAMPLDACLNELRVNSGTQFDPTVVEAALTVLSP